MVTLELDLENITLEQGIVIADSVNNWTYESDTQETHTFMYIDTYRGWVGDVDVVVQRVDAEGGRGLPSILKHELTISRAGKTYGQWDRKRISKFGTSGHECVEALFERIGREQRG